MLKAELESDSFPARATMSQLGGQTVQLVDVLMFSHILPEIFLQ